MENLEIYKQQRGRKFEGTKHVGGIGDTINNNRLILFCRVCANIYESFALIPCVECIKRTNWVVCLIGWLVNALIFKFFVVFFFFFLSAKFDSCTIE